jgi:hypothetical protein
VNAPTAVIEDACQTAWERLCTHPGVEPVAPSAVKWLVVTEMREVWRRAGGREIPTDPTDFAEPISDTPGLLERALLSPQRGTLGAARATNFGVVAWAYPPAVPTV